MEPKNLEIILEFIYTGKHSITEENVIDVLETAVLLGIKSVCKKCENLVLQKLNIENCMDILELSYTHNSEGLKAQILEFILPNFMDVMKQNNFYNLKLNDFIQIVKSEDLNVVSEDIVVESVLKWAEKNGEETRKENLGKIFQHLRLAHVSAETLFSLKAEGSPVSDVKVVQAKLDEALEYKILPARRQEMYSSISQYRKSFPVEEVMVTIGSLDPGTAVFAFSFLQQKWFKLPDILYDPGQGVAACCNGSEIFLFGGRGERAKDVLRYNAASNKWTSSTSLCEARDMFPVVAMTDRIYVVGGTYRSEPNGPRRILSSVEKYDIASGRSEICTNLPKPTFGCSTAVSGRKIFLFGEFYNMDTTGPDLASTHSCYMLNTVTNEFTLITELAYPTYSFRTVKSGRRVFMVQARGKIIEFIEIESDCKLLTEIENRRHVFFGAVPHRDNILIIGGRDPRSGLSKETIHFNTETCEVSNYSQSLPEPLLVYGCFKIEIDKKFLTDQV